MLFPVVTGLVPKLTVVPAGLPEALNVIAPEKVPTADVDILAVALLAPQLTVVAATLFKENPFDDAVIVILALLISKNKNI